MKRSELTKRKKKVVRIDQVRIVQGPNCPHTGNGTRHLLKCLELDGKFETEHMMKRDIAANSLKIVFKNLDSVKRYDKNKHEQFCFKSMGKFQLGLTYFGQFSYSV